jgi:hypothetical protein
VVLPGTIDTTTSALASLVSDDYTAADPFVIEEPWWAHLVGFPVQLGRALFACRTVSLTCPIDDKLVRARIDEVEAPSFRKGRDRFDDLSVGEMSPFYSLVSRL